MPRNNPNWGMKPRQMNPQYGWIAALIIGAAIVGYFMMAG